MSKLISVQGGMVLNELLGNISKDLVLGDIGYDPTEIEVKEICQQFIDATESFQKNFYLIYVHKMYEKEPYNCGSVSNFVEKHTNISRATFYRLINEIDINILIYGRYDPLSSQINSSICQELKSALFKIGALKTIELWYFLNTTQKKLITARAVRSQVVFCQAMGRVVPNTFLTEDTKSEIERHIDTVVSITSLNTKENDFQFVDNEYAPYQDVNDIDEYSELEEGDDIDEYSELEEGKSSDDEPLNLLGKEENYYSEYNHDLVELLRGNLRLVSLADDFVESLSVEDLALSHKAIFGKVDPQLVSTLGADYLAEIKLQRAMVESESKKVGKAIAVVHQMSNIELFWLSEYIESYRLTKK